MDYPTISYCWAEIGLAARPSSRTSLRESEEAFRGKDNTFREYRRRSGSYDSSVADFRVARHSLSRTYRKLGPSQLSQQHEGQIIPALWVVNPLSDGAGNHRDDVVERLVNLGH
jgi:hypothetical protein